MNEPEGTRVETRNVLDGAKELSLKELETLEDGLGDGDEGGDGAVDASFAGQDAKSQELVLSGREDGDSPITSSDCGAMSSASVVLLAMVRTDDDSVPVWYSVR